MQSDVSTAESKIFSRRKFLFRSAAGVGAAGAVTLGYTWRVEPVWIETVRRTLPIANLPAPLVGKTLVQISDLHVGNVVNQNYILSAMRKVNDLKPDLLVITGDFMTANGTEQISKMTRTIGHLAPANIATIGILGNHDYGHQWSNRAAADAVTDAMRGTGMTLLRNQVTAVAGLQIAGIDDMWGPNFKPAATLAQLDLKQPSLVLCHNPDAADLPVWDGYRGWILSGHTHGGQIKPPFLPPPRLPVADRLYVAGHYPLSGGRDLYINRGLGYIRRLRFNARPEITVFTLASC